jgi:hypothetical protein
MATSAFVLMAFDAVELLFVKFESDVVEVTVAVLLTVPLAFDGTE